MKKEHNEKRSNPKKRAAHKSSIKTWPLYILFIAFLILYVFFQGQTIAIVFGVIAIFLLITVIVLDFAASGKETGYLKNILEVVIALAIIIAFFFSLKYILNTNDPLDVVPSCSMLPVLQRGDMIVIQGTNLQNLRAPIVNVTKNDFASMENNLSNESLVCLAYKKGTGNTVQVSQYYSQGDTIHLFRFTGEGYVYANSQGSNLIKYSCGVTTMKFDNGSTANIVYTSGISIGNRSINGDLNNSIIVYQTVPEDYFYKVGDEYVVHRVYAVLNVSGTYYALTKGDNNAGLDIEYGNLPSNSTNVQGRIIADIPYVGYLRLLIGGSLQQPEGCNSTII